MNYYVVFVWTSMVNIWEVWC